MKKKLFKEYLSILYLAYLDSRTPWYIKFSIFFVIGYALSPIDLIPDFIPILGHLDDLILIPLGIIIILRLLPQPLLEEFRKHANTVQLPQKNWWVASLIVILWILSLFLLIWIIM